MAADPNHSDLKPSLGDIEAMASLPPNSLLFRALQAHLLDAPEIGTGETFSVTPPDLFPNHLSLEKTRGNLGYPRPAPIADLSFDPHWKNSVQYQAILRRKIWRHRNLDRGEAKDKSKESYHYESLHRHAKKRLRSPNGKFMSKEEIAKLTPGEHAHLEDLMQQKEEEKLRKAQAKRQRMASGGKSSRKKR